MNETLNLETVFPYAGQMVLFYSIVVIVSAYGLMSTITRNKLWPMALLRWIIRGARA